RFGLNKGEKELLHQALQLFEKFPPSPEMEINGNECIYSYKNLENFAQSFKEVVASSPSAHHFFSENRDHSLLFRRWKDQVELILKDARACPNYIDIGIDNAKQLIESWKNAQESVSASRWRRGKAPHSKN